MPDTPTSTEADSACQATPPQGDPTHQPRERRYPSTDIHPSSSPREPSNKSKLIQTQLTQAITAAAYSLNPTTQPSSLTLPRPSLVPASQTAQQSPPPRWTNAPERHQIPRPAHHLGRSHGTTHFSYQSTLYLNPHRCAEALVVFSQIRLSPGPVPGTTRRDGCPLRQGVERRQLRRARPPAGLLTSSGGHRTATQKQARRGRRTPTEAGRVTADAGRADVGRVTADSGRVTADARRVTADAGRVNDRGRW